MPYKLPCMILAISLLAACKPVSISTDAEIKARFLKMNDDGVIMDNQDVAYDARDFDNPDSEWACVYDNDHDLVWEVKTLALDNHYDGGGSTYSWYEYYSNPGWQELNTVKYEELDENKNYKNVDYRADVAANPDKYDPLLKPTPLKPTDKPYGLPDGGICNHTSCDTTAYTDYNNLLDVCKPSEREDKNSKEKGVNKWRLPTQSELRTLLVCTGTSESCQADNTLYIATSFFPNTLRGSYWAFENAPLIDKTGPSVDFMTGKNKNSPKPSALGVRLVYGPVQTPPKENP